MSSARSLLTAAACALFVPLSSVPSLQTRFIAGSVHRPDDDSPVVRTELSIEGAGPQRTTDTGEFRFPLLPPLKVGFPATFHVRSWVIIDPCVHERGRTYLPDPEAETIAIKVLPPGDRGLLSGDSLRCIIEEKASQFTPPKPG
jgi:hypothetical protein